MSQNDFWKNNEIERQIQESKKIIKEHQEKFKLLVELIIIVFCIGFLLNLHNFIYL
jgi:hypothetical protein